MNETKNRQREILVAVELKNCLETDAGIQYINRTPPYEWIFFLRGVFETPQTERLSAFVTVAEARGNVKGFFYGTLVRLWEWQ